MGEKRCCYLQSSVFCPLKPAQMAKPDTGLFELTLNKDAVRWFGSGDLNYFYQIFR